MAPLTDIELLSRLVAFDTTSVHSNLEMADFVADYVDHSAVRVHRNFNPEGDKVNLVLVTGPEPQREGLTLSGHMDVVPATEPEWESDPFRLHIDGDSLIARGAADMKGFLTLAINRFRACARREPAHPLCLLLTFDEELGLLGAQHFERTWNQAAPLPTSALIGEPTELDVVRLQKGHFKARATLRGVPAHSAYPHLGRSAIEPAAKAILALSELRRELEREPSEYSPCFPDAPFAALNIATIAGGRAINVVPDRCVIEIGVRLLPGMDGEAVFARMRSSIEALSIQDCEIEMLDNGAPLAASENSRLHRTLCGLVGQTGSRAVSYASDAGVFQRMGMECAIFGPGSIDVAHKPNEWMPRDQFEKAGEVLDRLIEAFCR